MKIKLPEGWEKCRVAIKGVRKWRNMATGCWVTELADDAQWLYVGVHGIPNQFSRAAYTAQQAIDELSATTAACPLSA